MNNRQERLDHYRDLIYQGRYSEVLRRLHDEEPSYTADLKMIGECHHYLCEYYKKGMDDPQRESIRLKMATDILELIDRISIDDAYAPSNYSPLSSKLLELRQQTPRVSISSLLASIRDSETTEYFDSLDRILDYAWSIIPLEGEDYEALKYTLSDRSADTILCRSLVGVMLVSALTFFDTAKIQLIILLTQHEEVSVRVAALAALTMIGVRYRKRLSLYPDLLKKGRLAIVSADADEIYEVMDAIYTSYTTATDHDHYKQKVIPELQDLVSKFNMPMASEDILSKLNTPEGTEDLQELEKMVSGLQAELPKDRDLSYHGITELKRSTFFMKMPHWFIPFTDDHPDLDADAVKGFKKVMPLLFRETPICSSDLYSYASVPFWSQMAEMMGSQIPDMKGIVPQFDTAYYAKDFVYGLYRFYALSPWGTAFVSPFKGLTPLHIGAFTHPKGAIPPTILTKISLRVLSLRLFPLAVETIDRAINEQSAPVSKLYRAYAMALVKTGQSRKAIDSLIRATELEGDVYIVALRIADLYAKVGNQEKAMTWYQKADEMDQADHHASMRLGALLITKERYEEASKPLFKAFFNTDGKDAEVRYLLSKALLGEGKATEAVSRLSEVPSNELRVQDRLLLGLCHIACRNHADGFKQLTEWYQEASADGEEVHQLFIQEAQRLERYEITAWERDLIYDVITA